MILEWRTGVQTNLSLEWRGPDIFTTQVARAPDSLDTIIAVITGPKGDRGDPGLPGPKGEKGDAAVFDESLPLILDGGNF